MTKKEKMREDLFDEQIKPLLTQLAELCTKHEMPLVSAVQIFTNKKDGARMAAQVVYHSSVSNAMLLASKILQGEASITTHPDKNTFVLKIKFDECEFDSSDINEIIKHAETCEICSDNLNQSLSDIDTLDSDNSLMPFIVGKNNIIH